MDSLEVLLAEREDRRISATRAAKCLGYSEGYIRGKDWRVPAYGLKGKMHSLRAWREWLAIPERERRAIWDNMPLDRRRRAI